MIRYEAGIVKIIEMLYVSPRYIFKNIALMSPR